MTQEILLGSLAGSHRGVIKWGVMGVRFAWWGTVASPLTLF